MKALFTTLASVSASPVFAADKIGDIKSLKVSFVNLIDGDTQVQVEGTVVGLACQQAFTKPALTLVEEDVDFNLYGVNFVSLGFGIGPVCLSNEQVVREFKKTLVLDEHTLNFTYLKGVEALEKNEDFIVSSLQWIKDSATCATPSIPALESGLFGVGPVLPEICTFEIEAAK